MFEVFRRLLPSFQDAKKVTSADLPEVAQDDTVTEPSFGNESSEPVTEAVGDEVRAVKYEGCGDPDCVFCYKPDVTAVAENPEPSDDGPHEEAPTEELDQEFATLDDILDGESYIRIHRDDWLNITDRIYELEKFVAAQKKKSKKKKTTKKTK